MDEIFQAVNAFFRFVEPLSDAIWDFPTQFAWYQSIPLLGRLSLPIVLLVGVGLYFSLQTRFVQLTNVAKVIGLMRQKQPSTTGISAFASFMLGLAMRIGPGNIVGVTGAISVGGPGALFWMWVAAFFGMATAFVESVLAQLFKEQKGKEFVGGLPFYGRRIFGNVRAVGVFLSIAFVIYALFNVPIQTFNVLNALGTAADTLSGSPMDRQSALGYGMAALLIASGAFVILGGIRRVAAWTDLLVPLMSVVFMGISLILIVANIPLIPYFFQAVFSGAFSPEPLFGGVMGTALAQGVKRGLMSNEAGQGTITMAAAVADNRHPCEQGFIQSLGVFFDTMVICTMTGFIVVMAHVWTHGVVEGQSWEVIKAAKIVVYLASVKALVPPLFITITKIVMVICYALFAFTTLLGMISFAEISANFISKSPRFIMAIRLLGSFVFVPFGTLSFLAKLELANLWAISDLMNIVMVYLNIPILLIGAPWVFRALAHYRKTGGLLFRGSEIGLDLPYWK